MEIDVEVRIMGIHRKSRSTGGGFLEMQTWGICRGEGCGTDDESEPEESPDFSSKELASPYLTVGVTRKVRLLRKLDHMSDS